MKETTVGVRRVSSRLESKSVTRRKRPNKPVTIIECCYGYSTTRHFSKAHKFGLPDLNIQVIAGCDNDPQLKREFDRSNPHIPPEHSFVDMRDMLRAVVNDYDIRRALKNVDIFSATAPCQGRSVLRLENNNGNLDSLYRGDELFFMQLILIELLKPKRVISEMTPPNHQFHKDHYEVARNIQNLGYEVIVTPRFASDLCGDYQHRERWILIGRRLPTQYPTLRLPDFHILDRMQHRGPPLKDILEDPRDVPSSKWIRDPKNRISLDVFHQDIKNRISQIRYPLTNTRGRRSRFPTPAVPLCLIMKMQNLLCYLIAWPNILRSR
mmetsp:Transcript_3613/g.10657  ORF Transcript_3613/g.10657 Transcript_3613/m.10657 type:complete len:324 (+) Transcript_3613:3412-4383(+)